MSRSPEQSFSENPYTIYARPDEFPSALPDFRLLDRLAQVYAEFSQGGNFPRNACTTVTEHVLKLNLGLQRVDGVFLLDYANADVGLKDVEGHTWLMDEQRRYYELTGKQFNPGLKRKFPPGIIVICAGTSMYANYLTRDQIELDFDVLSEK